MISPYYEDDYCTIYHADCRDVVPNLVDDVGVVVTDPPYGIEHKSQRVEETTTAHWMEDGIPGDEDTALRDWVLGQFSEWAVTASYKASEPDGYRGVLVWDKGPHTGMGDLLFPWKPSWELIYVAGERWEGKREEGVLRINAVVSRASMGRTHPNEKPVQLMSHFIRKHPAHTVLDPFMGTGATLIAAKNDNRKAVGVEIQERYCEVAAKRLSQGVLNLEAS